MLGRHISKIFTLKSIYTQYLEIKEIPPIKSQMLPLNKAQLHLDSND
jgi:hypothetical protein